MKTEDLLKLAKDRLEDAAEADRDNRLEGEDDLRKVIGDQWDAEARREREAQGKPVLTVNGLMQFVRQVTGQVRAMNPAIKVMAADGKASKDTAEVMEGLIRSIEYQSDASSIYEQATESAAGCGIGNWRILARYCDGLTFDQEIHIERIHNPFAVFWDPLAKDCTRKDARFCFVVDEMDEDEFEAAYPDKSAGQVTSDHKSQVITWRTDDTVTVAEYMWIDEREVEISQLADGRVVEGKFQIPQAVVATRKAKKPVCMWAKISANDVLEGPTELPTPYIPVVAVVGEEWHLGEAVYRSSVVRFAKDPQMLYNYAISSQAEIIAMQPKAPWLITAKQIESLEDMWADAHVTTRPYLVFNADPEAGAPQRMAPPVSSGALTEQMMVAAEDMKRTTGIYDASLGAQGNEKSGVAIRERKMEAQTNTSIYADNMVKSVTQTGKILCAMIPRIYDTNRVIRTLGEDNQEKVVEINKVMRTLEGDLVFNDMTTGKYDVRIGVGPSYSTKRQEAVEGMMGFLQANPQAAPLIGDLIAGMQDWPDADKVSARLKKTLPPGLLEQDEQAEPDPMQQQQQAMQMQAQQQAAQIEQTKATAEAREADANARKAEAEAMKAEIEAQQMLATARMQVTAYGQGMIPPGNAPLGAY